MRSLIGLALALFAATDSPTGDRAALPVPAGPSAGICTTATGDLPLSGARLLDFGAFRTAPVSNVRQAQRYYEQGLVFGWGFNFPEAARSFRVAAGLDPSCVLCQWGIAWALGPSINHDMREVDRPVALETLSRARALAAPQSREQSLIDALTKRYGRDGDRASLAYAEAMRSVALQFPQDADVAVWAAEAMMNAHPYDYWDNNGKAKPWTPEIIALLERALRLAPDHPGAHHYQIHLFEESAQPEQALPSADRLGKLAPIVGHLVHMPSHIFFRVGRYRDAKQANLDAVEADRAYSVQTGAVSDYATHNLHFLWASALWSDDQVTASSAAQELAADATALADDGLRQHLLAAPVLTRVRLGEWDAILSPAHSAPASAAADYFNGLAQFGNGMAYAAQGDARAARAQLELLRRSHRATQQSGLSVKNIHQAHAVLNVAQLQLRSAIAGVRSATDAARYARRAVQAEDDLSADDPPIWPLPSRHLLGAALLKAGAAAEAAAVYREDLRRYPNNPVALAGLAAAERRLQLSLATNSSSAPRAAPFSE